MPAPNPFGVPSLPPGFLESPMMQTMLNNPEFLRSMTESNPMLQRLAESNPQLAAALRDPEMLRQAIRLMGNPSLMQEQMRRGTRALRAFSFPNLFLKSCFHASLSLVLELLVSKRSDCN